MSEPHGVPPVPTVRQVGPAFAFFAFALAIGVYGIAYGATHQRLFPIITGAISGVGGFYFLVKGVKALRRLQRLNKEP